MERKIIPLKELPLKNDFMFGQVMRTPEICTLFLEELLGKEIDHIEYIENQKEINDSYEHHGIRLDVYLRTEYLDYIRTNDGSRPYTSELLHKTVKKVQEVRDDEKMEVSYMMWELKYQDAIAEGRAEGRTEGITEGILSSIMSLMETMDISVEKAMAALKIPEAEQQKYLDLLEKR